MWAELKNEWAYKDFHFRRITEEKYRHLFLLLFWVVFLPCYFIIQRVAVAKGYTLVHCALDDMIPFCEIFIIPYIVWYPFVALMIVYTVCFDIPAFVKLSKYLMITLVISVVIYYIWPTGQDMWPDPFPRENIFTWATGVIYSLDVNTNICPSEHVQSAFGVAFAAMHTKRLSGKKWMTFFWTETILVVFAVVFVKQHSVIDVAAAVPVILIGYFFAFRGRN